MSIKSKIAAIAAASLGMVLTQSSSLLAEKQNSNAPEKVTKTAAPTDLDEEVLYSAVSDDVLEKAAGFGGPGVCYTATCAHCNGVPTSNCGKGTGIAKVPPLSKSPTSKKSRTAK